LVPKGSAVQKEETETVHWLFIASNCLPQGLGCPTETTGEAFSGLHAQHGQSKEEGFSVNAMHSIIWIIEGRKKR